MTPARPRVLFVIDSLRMGGAEKSLVTLLSNLPLEEMDITLLVTALGGELERLLPAGISPRLLPMKSSSAVGICKSLIARVAMRIRRWCVRGFPANPDDFFWQSMAWSVPSLKEKFDIAVAYHQGFPTTYVATKVKAGRKLAWVNADIRSMKFDLPYNERFYRRFDSIVAVSGILRSILGECYPSLSARISVFNDLIDTQAIIRKADESPDPYPARDGALRILTVGRLDPVKGQDIALRAAAVLRDRGVDFRWYFIGDGPSKASLLSLRDELGLKDYVFFKGTIANPYPWMRHCDLYVQPSRHEGYGIALREAAILGRPLVITDFPVAREHITEGNGLISPIAPVPLAETIIRASESEKFNSMAQSAITTASTQEEAKRIFDFILHS